MAVALSLPSPYNSGEPKYFAKDIVDMYKKKRMSLSSFSSNQTILYFIWIIFCCVVSWEIGKYYFDHVNYDKAYKVLEEFIKKGIQNAEEVKLQQENERL